MNELAKTALTEDAWLFVTGAWTDIGCQEEAKSVQIDLRTVAGTLDMAAETPSAPGIAFYHIHLFSKDPTLVDPPSLQDIHSLVLLKRDYGEVTGVMIDGKGKWTFDIIPALQERILHDENLQSNGDSQSHDYAASHGYRQGSNSTTSFDQCYTLVTWSVILAERSFSRDQRIRMFIDGARELGVLVAYSTLPAPGADRARRAPQG
jgi:hypothetical protein